MVLHKRCRDQSACEDIETQPSAKRRKPASDNHPPEFWNALSRITLSRKSLREFDRRTQRKKPTQAVVLEKRATRILRPNTRRLAHFARDGGPDLSNLRGYAEASASNATVAMSRSSFQASKRSRDSDLPSSNLTTKTSTTGPYDSHFGQMLTGQGVYPDGYRTTDGVKPPKPENLDELRQNLSRPRPSLSPSSFPESEFENFQDMNRRVTSESKAMSRVIPTIAGLKDNQCESGENILFTNLEKFHPNVTAPKPDLYYGARTSQIDERVTADLGKYITPSTEDSLPAAPNFFLEAKSKSGRSDVLQRQAMYDGAIGARAMLELQNYRNSTRVYDGNAYSGTATYHPGEGTLKLYATHPRQSPNGRTEFYTTQLGVYAMTHAPETFRQGAAAYRNYRDHNKEQRDRIIAHANATAQRLPVAATPSSGPGSTTNLSSATISRSFDSDTSADELALDHATDSFANHDLPEPERYRPHKRVAQSLHTPVRLRSRVNASAFDVHARNRRRQMGGRKAQHDDTEEDDEENNEDDEEDDEDDQASRVARQAQRAMKRLLRQGCSKQAAFEQLVLARQQSQQVARKTAVTQVRAMLAYQTL